MTKQQAIKVSLEYWYQNHLFAIAGDIEYIDYSPDSYPLCQKYKNCECIGCPIKEKTGYPNCRKTPYRNVVDTITTATSGYKKACIEAIEKEIAFLETL